MADTGQRTEQPTPQRLRKAREDGRFPASREFVASLQLTVFVALVVGFAPDWIAGAEAMTRRGLSLAFRGDLTAASVTASLRFIAGQTALPLVLAGVALVAVSLLAQVTATGFGFAPSRLAPSWDRLNPAGRLKDLPRLKLGAFAEAMLLFPLILAVFWMLVSRELNAALSLPYRSLLGAVAEIGRSVSTLLWHCSLILLAWGALDLFRQKRRYWSELRMTRQEVRDEFKHTEGNPEVKMRLRRLRRDLLRRRMINEVPKATAVIVNPTHFAVALKYDVHGSGAPRVVAKGKNYLALRIRAIATANHVPVVENPPLARSLYQQVQVGQEIPASLYRAVAEVLAYVFRLMNRRFPGASS